MSALHHSRTPHFFSKIEKIKYYGKKIKKMARLGTLRRIHGLSVSFRPARFIPDGAPG